MGDATNLVLIFAGELLKRSEHLLTMGLHPSDVILGYEMALVKAREELECESSFPFISTRYYSEPPVVALVSSKFSSSPLPTSAQLAESISSSLASKQPGSEQFLSSLVAEASLAVMPKNPRDFNVDSVRVVKVLGGSLDASRVVRGMVFGREPEGVVKKATKAKVAAFTSGLDISQTETKGTVLLKKAEELLDFTRGEEKQLEKVSFPLARWF